MNVVKHITALAFVKCSASARLQKIENHISLVIWNKYEQVLTTCTIIYICVSPYALRASADDVTSIFGSVC